MNLRVYYSGEKTYPCERSLQCCKNASSDPAVRAGLLGQDRSAHHSSGELLKSFTASTAVYSLPGGGGFHTVPFPVPFRPTPPRTPNGSVWSSFPPGANTLRPQTLPVLQSRGVIWPLLAFSETECSLERSGFRSVMLLCP